MRKIVFCLLLSASFLPWLHAGEISLVVEEPSGVSRSLWPVTSGIPFAKGDLRDETEVALFDNKGNEVPLQTEVLSRWKDQSIRWLLLDFQVDLAARQKSHWGLKYGKGVKRSPISRPVVIEQSQNGKVNIDTGIVRLFYDSQSFQPEGEASWSGNDARPINATGESSGIYLRAADKEIYTTSNTSSVPARFALEQKGPLRCCLLVEGEHKRADGRLFRYVARVHAYRGKPWVRVQYTFINDYQESLMADIQELGVRFEVRDALDQQSAIDGKVASSGRLFQVDEAHYQRAGKTLEGHAKGWAAVTGKYGGMAVGLRQFWQNWPKAIQCGDGHITLELCPPLPAGLYGGKSLEEENKLYYALQGGHYRFKVGVAKTHEFFVDYFQGDPDGKELDEFFRAAEIPLMAIADPDYVCTTRALGDFPAAGTDDFCGYDQWLGSSLERHLAIRQQQREYGLLNYGDWFGERRVNWGNLEYDLAHGMFVQYLRTGDRRYFDRGEQAARHHIDVDVIHATNPFLKNPWGAPPQVGEIWLHCLNHTGGYYLDTKLPVSRTYHMGHSTNFGHVWSGGDFELYLLTGDRRALDVAKQISDAMVNHCPTSYGNHIRGLGWPIVLVLNAYEATGDQKYLDAATSCWKVLKKNFDWKRGWVVKLAKGHCVHKDKNCYGNVPFMEGLTVSALARYHRLTKDPEVLRAMSVAIDQMIRECWVEEDKAFRYAACPLSTPRSYNSMCLAAEGMAYEARLTGNAEHRRILREGLLEVMKRTKPGMGKGLAQAIHFTPYALDVLRD